MAGLLKSVDFCEKLKETNNPAELKWIASVFPAARFETTVNIPRYPFKIFIELRAFDSHFLNVKDYRCAPDLRCFLNNEIM